MTTTLSLPVPSASISELWTQCTDIAERLHELRIALDVALHHGNLTEADSLHAVIADARLTHEIMTREYNRRTAR